MQSLIGIDFGLKRIGFATGQTLTNTATELKTIENHNQAINWSQIDDVFQQWQPSAVVLGLPKNKDGTDHALTKTIRRFAQQLEQRYDMPVHFEDERQSSSEAEYALQQQRSSGSRKKRVQKSDIDQMAAAIILQRWLDKQ